MFKFLKIISILIAFPFFLCRSALALEGFQTENDITYQFLSDGMAKVNQKISITNLTSDKYATNYLLTLQGGKIASISAKDNDGPIKIQSQINNNQTVLDLSFNEKVVGKGKTLNFNVSYESRGLANQTGQIWEINIPQFSPDDKEYKYSLTLIIPKSFGNLSYLNPKSDEQQETNKDYTFMYKKQDFLNPVNIVFGQIQIFDFNLSYHLENPHLTSIISEIALPPDTAYQKVIYKKIDPVPNSVKIDQDGNWIASYRLSGKEKLNIVTSGKVKIFSSPQEIFFKTEDLAKNLLPVPYWPSDNPIIKNLADNLKSPKQIYDFVVETLDYDYSRVQINERLGAIEALNNPQKAICLEFSDLFIAIARAAGIPTREINGFAYTTDPKLRPLGIFTDVLHSWPEYYDESKQLWIPVDPTWGKTTGGIDYFNKIDLNHFAFVIHGENSERPLPAGSYKTGSLSTKDVQVKFGQYEPDPSAKIDLATDVGSKIYSELINKGKIIVKNNGQSSAYNLPLVFEIQGFTINSPKEIIIDSIPPYGKIEIPFELRPKFFSSGEGKILVKVNDHQYFQIIRYRSLLLEIILPLTFILLILTITGLHVKNKISNRTDLKKSK